MISQVAGPRQGLAIAVLLIAAIAQGQSLAATYIVPTLRAIHESGARPPWERSALLSAGPDFADYIRFVRSKAPDDARVILPPRFPVRREAHVGLMQYFLFPRDIHNCGINEVEACIRRVSGSNTYVLRLADFPPSELAELTKIYLHFDGRRGLYAPQSTNLDE